MNDKELESLAFMAISELIDELKNPNSIAKWVGRYVYRFEIYREGVIHPSNKYLADAYNRSTGGSCSVKTMMVAVSVCKKSGAISITGKGKNRILELNVSTIRKKMAEIQGRRLFNGSARQELEAFRQSIQEEQYNGSYNESYKVLYKDSYNGSYKLEGQNNRGKTSPYSKGKSGKGDSKEKNTIELEFAEFWKLYPRKIDKRRAFQSYQKAREKKSIPKEQIFEGLDKYLKEIEYLKTDKRFICHPTTWLNNERWGNEYELGENPLSWYDDDDESGEGDVFDINDF